MEYIESIDIAVIGPGLDLALTFSFFGMRSACILR